MAINLKGKLFFGSHRIPVHIARVATGTPGELAHPYDTTDTEHAHDFTELVIILAGSGVHRIENADHPVDTGDVFLLQGRQTHFFPNRNRLSMVNVMFDPARIALPTQLLRSIPGYHALFLLEPAYRRHHQFSSRLHLNRAALGHVEGVVTAMEREMRRGDDGFEAMLLSHLIELIVYLSRQYAKATAPEAQSLLRIGTILQRFEQNFDAEYSLADLALEVKMSKVHLVRIFKKATGEAPIQYLIRLRIREAMQLLRETSLPVTIIAHEVGFNESNYFARQFRRITNVSPTGYRRLHGKSGHTS